MDRLTQRCATQIPSEEELAAYLYGVWSEESIRAPSESV